MNRNFTRLAFTDSVKRAQQHYGTRKAYQRMENAGDRYQFSDRETDVIHARDNFYLATVGENGWPYVQHRGGPKGFLKVLDDSTLGYADFRGNGQYISTGNLQADNKSTLILMDYAGRQRLKIWAETSVIAADEYPELLARLQMPDYPARIERLMILNVQAWDWNCPQHITPRYTREEFAALED